jgi:hypothetical protein
MVFLFPLHKVDPNQVSVLNVNGPSEGYTGSASVFGAGRYKTYDANGNVTSTSVQTSVGNSVNFYSLPVTGGTAKSNSYVWPVYGK